MSPVEPRAPRTSVRDQPRLQRRPRVLTETWSWYFMRMSGLVLLFLALFHFFLTHIINDVVETDSAFVASRWSNPLWRLYDWALLVLGLLHGVNGGRFITDDYVRTPWKRALTKTLMYGTTGVLLAWGTLTIVTYQV